MDTTSTQTMTERIQPGQCSAAAAEPMIDTTAAAAAEDDSVRYLCTVASELNDVGAELHASLLGHSSSSSPSKPSRISGRELFDASLSLYKEGVSAVMEAVDGGIASPGLDTADFQRAGTRRMEMIVKAKEKMMMVVGGGPHDASAAAGKQASASGSSRRRTLRECMFSRPDSACDSGPLLMMSPVKSPRSSATVADNNNGSGNNDDAGSRQAATATANDIGSVTLGNIGLLQLHRATSQDDAGAFDTAAKFFRMAAAAGEGSMYTNVRPEVSRAMVQCLNNLGHCMYREGRYDEALGCFRGAEAVVETRAEEEFRAANAAAASMIDEDDDSSSSWEDEARIILLCNTARTNYAACDFHSASRACQEALTLCLLREDDLASSCRRNNRTSGDDDDSSLASSLLYNLALIHEEQGLPERALSLYRKFIDSAPADGATSEIVSALTRVLLLECRQLARRSNKSSSLNASRYQGMDDVASVLRHLRDTQDELGPDHRTLASVLRCVGSSLSDRGEFKYALPFLLESLRMERRGLDEAVAVASADGDLSADVIVALNAVGECYHGLEKHDRAAEFYAEARDVQRSRLGGMLRCSSAARAGDAKNAAPHRSPSSVRFIVAVTMYNGGRVQFELGKRDAADGYFTEALALVDDITSSDAASPASAGLLPECGSLRHNIGQYKLELGRTTDALACFDGALRVRLAAFGPARSESDPSVAETLYQLGALYHRTGDSRRALEAFRDNLRIERNIHGGDDAHPSVALVLYNIAQLHYSTCELERALEVFRQVLSLLMSTSDPQAMSADDGTYDGLTVGNLRGWVGTVLGEMGLVHEARVELDLSVREQQWAGGTSSTLLSQQTRTGTNGSGVDAASFVKTFAELTDLRPAAAA